MVEGSHTDSNKRHHVFDKNRILRFAANTNAFLRSGGRVPWQQDHQKTQASNLGDLEGELVPAVITRENLPDPRLTNLIGKLGLFTDRLVAKGTQAVQDVLDGKIRTLSPGIDLVDDIIREVSATPTPAIVGLSTFRRADSTRTARFALTMEQATAEDQDFDSMKEEFMEIGERFWRVVTDINSAPPEELEGEDPSVYLEKALFDYSDIVASMLRLDEEEQPAGEAPSMGAAALPRPVSDQQRSFSMSNPMSYYTMGDVLGLAEFGRGKDKQKRKRRGGMVAAGVGGTGVVAAGGRYGTAAVQGARGNMAANTAAANRKGFARLFGAKSTGVSNVGAARAGAGGALASDLARAKRFGGSVAGRARSAGGAVAGRARSAGGAVAGRSRSVASSVRGGASNTIGAIRKGYATGAASVNPKQGFVSKLLGRKAPAQAGRVRTATAGLRAAGRAGLATRGGKVGLGIAAAGALGGGVAGVAGLRRRRRRA